MNTIVTKNLSVVMNFMMLHNFKSTVYYKVHGDIVERRITIEKIIQKCGIESIQAFLF